jgi:hypothetical protein
MLQLIVKQRSEDSVVGYVERVKQRIFQKMHEGMQEAMEGLAGEVIMRASADGIQARSGEFFEKILESAKHVQETPDLIIGRVVAEDTLGRKEKHIGLWLIEGTHVPATKLSENGQRRKFNRKGYDFLLHKAFMFTAGGATVWAAGHKAFDVRPRPILSEAKESFTPVIMQIIAARVAEAYE